MVFYKGLSFLLDSAPHAEIGLHELLPLALTLPRGHTDELMPPEPASKGTYSHTSYSRSDSILSRASLIADRSDSGKRLV